MSNYILLRRDIEAEFAIRLLYTASIILFTVRDFIIIVYVFHFGFTSRSCTKDYNIPNTNAVIEKGTYVMISVSGIHYDAKYFENPNEFCPERFDNDKTFLERPFLAFGEGPRNCIAMRLGKIQAKIGVVLMLKKFKFDLTVEDKNRELEIDPCAYSRTPINGIHLKCLSRH